MTFNGFIKIENVDTKYRSSQKSSKSNSSQKLNKPYKINASDQNSNNSKVQNVAGLPPINRNKINRSISSIRSKENNDVGCPKEIIKKINIRKNHKRSMNETVELKKANDFINFELQNNWFEEVIFVCKYWM